MGDGFDAVVSSIAIHNVRDPAVMRQVFAGVLGLLRPGGVFLDQDLVRGGAPAPGSLADHLGWLRDRGVRRRRLRVAGRSDGVARRPEADGLISSSCPKGVPVIRFTWMR